MIQIINYGAGNIRSVQNALKQLGIDSEVISSANEIKKDTKIIFPGVGAAGSAMKQLEKGDFIKVIRDLKNPFLGICLGMQLLAKYSEENNTKCIGVIEAEVKKFTDDVKIPQIGWNQVKQERLSQLFNDIPDLSYFYFVNSYYVNDKANVLGSTEYGVRFASIIQKDNFYGVQFHPEKSGEIGLKLLNNFCTLC